MANAHYLNNHKLERNILDGDRDAVARSIYTLAEHVVAMQLHTLPPVLDAGDVVQVAVVDAMRRLESWEPGRASAFSYATGSIKFSIMAEAKKERAWAERHSALLVGLDGEAA